MKCAFYCLLKHWTFFLKDNDRKHTSKSTQQCLKDNGLSESVMVTAASSPDLNPIENVWSARKTYLRSAVKPKKKDELVQGIQTFWETLTAEKCVKFIDHVHRVLPHVILRNGNFPVLRLFYVRQFVHACFNVFHIGTQKEHCLNSE